MLVKVDRYSMQHSLEVVAFLDKDLVDYAFSIPGKKIGFSGKKILRNHFLIYCLKTI